MLQLSSTGFPSILLKYVVNIFFEMKQLWSMRDQIRRRHFYEEKNVKRKYS